MYEDVGGSNNHIVKMLNGSSDKSKDIYWSRFVPKEKIVS